MRECLSCGNYQAYYTKGHCKFEKAEQGNCVKNKKTVQKNESCEQWRNNDFHKKVRKTVCLKALNNIISDLAELRQILGEEILEPEDN